MGKKQHLGKFYIFLSMVIKWFSYNYNIPDGKRLIKNLFI